MFVNSAIFKKNKMQKYYALAFFIGLCFGYGHGLEQDVLNLPVLDYDDTRSYDTFWDAQNDLWHQETFQEQKQGWDLIMRKLCENNYFTLEGKLINCENIEITAKIKKAEIKKRDVADVLEEGSGDDVPDEPTVEEEKEFESVVEPSLSAKSSPLEVEESNTVKSTLASTALLESAPKSDPVESVSIISAPVENSQVETAPVETDQVKTVPVETMSVETDQVKTVTVETVSVKPASVKPEHVATAPEETVPVETTPIELSPVKPAPLGSVPVEPSPSGSVVVDSVPETTGTVKITSTAKSVESPHTKQVVSVDSKPVETVPVESNPVASLTTDSGIVESKTTARSVKKTSELAIDIKKEEAEEAEKSDKGSGSNGVAEEKKNVVSIVHGRKATQEELNNAQSGVAIYHTDANMAETEEKLNNMKTKESMKTASIGGVGESTEAQSGTNDNKILITLFVAVLAVGIAAFSYNYIKRRKRNNSAHAATTGNAIAKSDPEEGSEMKPLMKAPEKSTNVEYKNEKQEKVDA